MLLSCRMFNGVTDVNDFTNVTQYEYVAGTPQTIYIQLIDASKDKAIQGFNPAGKRYTPASGATLQVVVDCIDDAKKIIRTATQPFSGDLSIWSFSILATDKLRGTATLRLKLTEGAIISYGSLPNAISITPQDASPDFQTFNFTSF